MKQEDCRADASIIDSASKSANLRSQRTRRSSRRSKEIVPSEQTIDVPQEVVVEESDAKRRKRDNSKSNKGKTRSSGRTTRSAATTNANNKSVTKGEMTATSKKEAYSYSDLFPADDDQDVDENVDVGDEDSEYAPSDEEVARRLSRTPTHRKGASAGTRRHSKNIASVQPDGGSTDEDEAGESESESDDDEEDDLGEVVTLEETMPNGTALFEDENNQVRRDIYDFDAQSIISDQRVTSLKKRFSTSGANRTSNVPTTRSTRRSSAGAGTSWGSNIYSALAAALKTRADLDAYSSFLKSTSLNASFDQLLAEMCKPSNQHANLFYGASASLQSLMSRINDHDKVVELLHAFVSRPYGQLQHRISYLIPVIHQPLFGVVHVPQLTQALDSITKFIDEDIIIKPGYILNQDTNLLAIPNSIAGEFGVAGAQYNLLTGAGNLGRYLPDIKQFIVPSDVHHKLTELIALPPERLYELALARAHQQDEEAGIDISPLEPPNLQRIVIALNADGDLLGLAVLDTWNRTDVPHGRPRIPIDLVETGSNVIVGSGNHSSREVSRQSTEDHVREVLNNIIDWVVLKSDPSDYRSSKRGVRHEDSVLGQIYFMDAFLVKPNGRRDTLLLVAHRNCCHPPFDNNIPDGDNFRVYSVMDESRFLFEKYGFISDMPIALDGVHSADPEELLEDKSLLVVPDLLFDTLRKVLLREIVSSSGTATSAAVVATANPEVNDHPLASVGQAAMIHCTKFVILDSQKRVPLTVAFDSPVRLTLQVSSDKLGVHPHGSRASTTFDQITPSELKAFESSFKPTTAEYRLVAINGLLLGLQIDDKRVVRRIMELVPARLNSVYPHTDSPSLCAQSAVAAHMSCPSNVRIVNDETNSSTVLPAFYYPHFDQNKLNGVVSGFTDHLCSLLFELPITISLYDVVLRMAQKYMPEILAKQHIEAAEAAAYAEAAANPHAPPPAPVPLPEHWGVCCICAKELRSPNGLLDHEMRHLGLSRFRCTAHNLSFLDRRSWQAHMNEYHISVRPSLPSTLQRQNAIAPTDSGSEPDYEEEDVVEQDDTHGGGVLVGLTNVFNTGLLVGRMEAPQCEKCGDYFPSAELLAQHLDFCDGVSFCIRTPIPRSSVSTNKSNVLDDTTGQTTDGTGIELTSTNIDTLASEMKEDVCVCGVCGGQVPSRDKILRHFTNYHLQCILCSKILRSMEELSCHYQIHLTSDASHGTTATETNDTEGEIDNRDLTQKLKSKVIVCDICADFCGTKYNYYFHQWAEHGVVHPPVGSVDGVPKAVPQPRHSRQRLDKDDPISIRRMKCKVCGMVVRVNGREYVQHLNEKHGITASPDIVCRICAEIFESPGHLSSHLGEAHAPSGEFMNAGVQTIFRCTHCDFWGFSKGLLRHAREVHEDLSPSMYECIHCYERFSDKRTWRAHLDKHNEGYSHRCIECGRVFRLRPSLLHHMRTHHGEDQSPATCEHCGLTYPKRSSLRYHIFRMHNNELAHECFMCQRRFRLETELRRHVKETHSGAVKCEICHKVCQNLRSYAQHRQKHFRTRIYQCTDCQTTFKSKLAMKRHIRVEHLQLGPEKFECQICGKIVTQIGMHMLIHKEARYECEYCGKKFTKAAYYGEHLRIHRGEQPFECHICRKRFNKKSNLNVHLRFHEKHRDEEGNYLELRPRGRMSSMFGDASLNPDDRAARQAAFRANNITVYVPKVDAAVGSDFPGAFNCTGPAGAAAEAASRVAELYGIDGVDNNHSNSPEFIDWHNLESDSRKMHLT